MLCMGRSGYLCRVTTAPSLDPYAADDQPPSDLDTGTLRDRRVPWWRVAAWGAWDWGTQPFATVITTFVFSVYLTSNYFGAGDGPDKALSWAMGIAGLVIALLAPVLGQGSDRSGHRMRNLLLQTLALAAVSASLWLVKPDPSYLILGLVLLGVGNVVQEIANVNYYASIERVASPKNVGRVSGIGWGMGYMGGIAILVIIVALYSGGGFSADEIRNSMLICGAWTLLWTIPIFLSIRDNPVAHPAPSRGVIGAYKDLFASIKRIYRNSPHTVWFLLASALFRDGLAGVFTFGAILAAGTFGFETTEIMIFGIVANLAAGIATMLFGLLDDKIGPKRVILISLGVLVVLGLVVFALHDEGKMVFWVCGLLMTLFVGPAQSASRSFLARAIPEGKSGEIFGLYATTGRAVSFLSPLAFGAAMAIGGWFVDGSAQYFGILGIVVVLLLGLVVMIPVKEGGHSFE